ncbi:MAG: hypothetical protein IT324_32315 [Anaerolineae bacterium]|nr:hypothetical protein [Anaerolineae bacterium]
MRDSLNRLLNLRPGEFSLVVTLGFLLMFNALAQQVSGVVAVSGFLNEVGVSQILIVWVIDYLLITISAGLQSLIVDRFDRVTLIKGVTLGFAIVFIALRLMFTFHVPAGINYSLLYLLADQQWLFFPLIFWVLANDIFDMTQAKRLFPVIASFSFIGTLIGIGIGGISPTLLRQIGASNAEVLNINVLIYLLAYVVVLVRLGTVKVRKTAQQHETVRETLTEGWAFVREVPSFRFLMLAIIAATLADSVVEFHFLSVSEKAFPDTFSYQQFYSLYRLGTVLIAVVLQSFVTSRLIGKIGLKHMFFIFPAVLLGGLATMLAAPAAIINSVASMMAMRLSKDTIDESTRKSFQSLVPEERRGRVSMFMETYLPAIGTIAAAILIGAILIFGPSLMGDAYVYAYLIVGAIAAIAALIAILNLRKVYDSSMFNWRLKRRQRTSSVLDKLEF